MLFEKLKNGAEIHTFCPKSIYYNEKYDVKNIEKYRSNIINISKNKKLYRGQLINIDTSHNTDYYLNKDLIFKDLLASILKECVVYLKRLEYDQDFLDKLFIESAWFNLGKKGDSLIKHIHPGSFLSGAYYVSCDKEDKIIFYGDDDMILPPNIFNELSSKYITYQCIPGSLLLFKSNLNHGTNPQKSNEKITISFNINYERN
tara:strand:+ start:153 stop:761 length:609 start_codon:yes stop_codon:yes gene_type:complete